MKPSNRARRPYNHLLQILFVSRFPSGVACFTSATGMSDREKDRRMTSNLETNLRNLPRAAALLAAACAWAPLGVRAQDNVGSTALTVYSTTQPGAVPADLYRPLPGQGNVYNGQAVPGYAMIRQERTVDLKKGLNRLNFRDVAAYIDPTTVTFESLTAPDATRVIEQRFEFDLVSTDKLMQRYVDQVITVDQLAGDKVVPIKGKLYLVGGYVEGWQPTDEVHEYDPAAQQWRPLARLPTARGALAVGVLNGRIFAVGGVGRNGRNTTAHEAYDIAAGRWTSLSPLATARDHLAVAVLGGRLHALGGRIDGSYSRNLRANEVFDPAANRWEQRARMPTARSGIAAANLDGRIVVVGGEAPGGTFGEVEAYDPASDGWSNLPRLPTPRHGLGAVTLGGKLYVISGGPTPGGSSSAANEVFTP